VAILATHPIQYQAPLWRRLAADPHLRVHVIYGSDLSVRGYRDREFGVQVQWDTPLTSGYSHEFLDRDPSLQRVDFKRPAGKGMGAAFDRFRPDVVLLNAYNGLFWLRGLMEARLRGIPVVMRHEASDEAMTRTPLKSVVRDAALRALYSQVARFAAIGTNARRHLLRLGVSASRIGSAPYCVDSDEFEKQYLHWMPQRESLRRELGVREEDFVLIFSGKLIPKKQPLLLLEAIGSLPEPTRTRTHLIVMGDGEQRAEVERVGRQLLDARLHLAGFVNQSQVGRWYAAADCLVLPSRRGAGETWGLVVNEALQFGLRVIVSDGVGCSADLQADDAAVEVFSSTEVASLRTAIERVLAGSRQPEAVRGIAARFSIRAAEEGLTEAVRAAAEGNSHAS
jgi:glycosyltransferase involved in cell wall biosynthesis